MRLARMSGYAIQVADDGIILNPACQFCGYRCGRARTCTLPGARAVVVLADARRTHGHESVSGAGNAAADRIVRVSWPLRQTGVDPPSPPLRRRGHVPLPQ